MLSCADVSLTAENAKVKLLLKEESKISFQLSTFFHGKDPIELPFSAFEW